MALADPSKSMYFRFLLASIFIISVSAQSTPYNLETTQIFSTQLSISWTCYDQGTFDGPDDEYQVYYQLTYRGQCDTGSLPPFDSTESGTWNRQDDGDSDTVDIYKFSATLTKLLPYSTYRLYVQARQPIGNGQYYSVNSGYINPDPTTITAAPETFGSGNITYTQNSNRLDFQWTIPCSSRNGVITGYNYHLTYDNGDSFSTTVTQLISSWTSTATITGLSCDTTYRFYVAGINSAGEGAYSEYKTATTTCCTRAPSRVTNLQQGIVTATSIQVTWMEPTFKGECPTIDSYEATGTGVSRLSGCPSQSAHNLARQTSASLLYSRTPARPYYIYTINVNPVGGPMQQIMVFTQQSAPYTAPTNIELTSRSSSSLTISWDEIPCGLRNGIITGYPYQLFEGGNRITEMDAFVSSATVIIQDLTPNTNYVFYVAAQTIGGAGTMSYGYTFRTGTVSVNLPTPPTSISADTIRSTSIHFVWDAASCLDLCPGGITGYSWRLLKSGVETRSDTTVADQRRVTISGLIPCTEYEFRVAGKSGDGMGSYSYGEIATTAEEAPGMVVDLVTYDETRTSISLAWYAPSSSCAPTIYTVEYRLTNRDQCEPIIDGPRMSGGTASVPEFPSKTISGLLPYSTYEVYVYASNGYGNGPEANVTTTTDEDIPSAAPDNVTVTSTSRSSLSFSWDEVPCGNRHGVIQNYQYRLKYNVGTGTVAIDSTSARMVTIMSGLSPCTIYRFSARALSPQGISNSWSDDIDAITSGAVDALTVASQSSTELAVSWTVPSQSCTTNAEYTVEYRLKNKDQCMELGNSEKEYGTVSGTSSALTGLLPYSTYEVSVRVGKSVATETAITQGSTPTGVPHNLTALATNSSVTFTWSEPPCGQRNGIITGYTYSFIEGSRAKRAVSVEDETTTETTKTFTELDIYTEYTFTIAANTEAGRGVETTMSYRTLAGVPTAPTQPKEADSKPGIQWSAPDMPNGEIMQYIIRYWSSDDMIDMVEMTVEGQTLMYTLPDSLETNTTYYIQVRAKTSAGVGPWSDAITVFIAPIGTPLSQGGSIGPIIGGIVAAIIFIILIVILVIFVMRRKRKQSENPPEAPPFEMKDEPISKPEEGHYANHGAFSSNGINLDSSQEEPDSSPPKKPEPAAKRQTLKSEVVIPVAAVAARPDLTDSPKPVVKRGTVYNKDMDDEVVSVAAKPAPAAKPKKLKPVKVESLAAYIAKQQANHSEGFRAEFESIPIGQEHPWEVSQKKANEKKNRYMNIAAYDHSRVILEKLEGMPHSDYINSNYVKGYKDKLYIASQGPNKGAMGDIWRMAWEQNTTKIVMLTNMVEGGKRKCEKYWPDTAKEPFVCAPMTVRHKETYEYADYAVRDFVLQKDGEDAPREIRQFHFISWPDMGLPEYPTPLINFLRIVNTYQPEGSGIPIIHCSAGVGRTGTYITVDAMLEMAAETGKIDVHGQVKKLRDDRITMVQTRGQYEFIYDTVKEAVLCGDTAILITNLRQEHSDLLSTVNKKTGNTKIVDQWKNLEALTVIPKQELCYSAYDPLNVSKNRFPDRVPTERVRTFLMSNGGEGSTNYINASFLDGFLKKGEYIVTQMPLPHTVEDFWRMIYDYKSPTIVMLNGMSHSDPSLGTYWIDSGILSLTHLTVEFLSTKKYMTEVVGRIFKIYPTDKPKDFITVQQFQFLDWPLGQNSPDSITPLISMVTLMQKWHDEQKDKPGKKPITVHCIDGLGVSGIFCAMVGMLNKMKAEKAVDVFQSVKTLRMNRPGLVANIEQYKFLYKAAQVSLEEFEIYENFRQ